MILLFRLCTDGRLGQLALAWSYLICAPSQKYKLLVLCTGLYMLQAT